MLHCLAGLEFAVLLLRPPGVLGSLTCAVCRLFLMQFFCAWIQTLRYSGQGVSLWATPSAPPPMAAFLGPDRWGFFRNSLLRYKPHSLQSTRLNCAIQWPLRHSQALPRSTLEHFHSPEEILHPQGPFRASPAPALAATHLSFFFSS